MYRRLSDQPDLNQEMGLEVLSLSSPQTYFIGVV